MRAGIHFGAGPFVLGAGSRRFQFGGFGQIFDDGNLRWYVEALLGQASPQPQCEWWCARAAEGGLRAGTRFGAVTFVLGAGSRRFQFGA